mgnify:FL=1
MGVKGEKGQIGESGRKRIVEKDITEMFHEMFDFQEVPNYVLADLPQSSEVQLCCNLVSLNFKRKL